MEDIPEEPWSDWKFQDMCNKWTHFGWFCIPQHFSTIRPGFRKAWGGRDLNQFPTSAPHEFSGSCVGQFCWGLKNHSFSRVNMVNQKSAKLGPHSCSISRGKCSIRGFTMNFGCFASQAALRSVKCRTKVVVSNFGYLPGPAQRSFFSTKSYP